MSSQSQGAVLPVLALLAAAVVAGAAAGRIKPPAAPPPGAAPTATERAPARAGGAWAVRRRIAKVVRVIEAERAPGGVIGVIGVSGGSAGSYRQAFGAAAPGRPMTLADHFRIGSITKTFTATVILRLVQQGALRLTDPISTWEPQVPNARRITIGMLLGMRSGIWDEGGSGPTGPSLLTRWVDSHCQGGDPACGQKVWTPQQIVNLAIRQGAAYPPGVYYYSDTNYVILGIIAQDVTRTPFARLLRRLVLDPLRLRHTSFPTSRLAIPRPAAAGYELGQYGYQQGDVLNPSASFAAGNMISTMGDLLTWARALGTGVLLSPRLEHLRLRWNLTPAGFEPLAGTGITTGLVLRYGLGVADLGNLLGHNGVYVPPGYTSEMWYLPSQRVALVGLFNSATPCRTERLSDAAVTSLAQAAFGSALDRAVLPAATCPVPPGG